MRRKIYLLVISLYLAITGNCQFIPMPLSYPNTTDYAPEYISIVDVSNVWLGTRHFSASSSAPYSWAVKTTDGGNTWEFDSIPVPGQPYISSLFAVNANTCFYVFTDNWVGGSIWKTTDGGATWLCKTTTQFSGVGAFADFYLAFDANEGVAVGDPTNGYFEILRTTNGGDSWTRVDSSFIPLPLPGEMGLVNAYSVVGDNIWFPSYLWNPDGTMTVRCFRSTDRGQHWAVSPIISTNLGNPVMDFSTPLKGVLSDDIYPNTTNKYYRTSDGGNTWTHDSLSIGDDKIYGLTSVPGIDGGFIVATLNPDSTGYLTKVLFTPDFFSTIIVIDTNLISDPWGLKFKDASTGWLSAMGVGANTEAMLKYNGLLTSISNAAQSPEKLAIMPNPTSAEALVKLPEMSGKGDFSLMIYDCAGKLCETRPIESKTGWSKLNASGYNNGVYLLQVVLGNRMIAQAKWIVQH